MKNLQSTKKSYKDVLLSLDHSNNPSATYMDDEFHPSPDPLSPKTLNCFSIIIDINNSNTGFIDLTGRFPYRSSRGYQYLLLLYDYDSNAILVEPLKNRTANSIIKSLEKDYKNPRETRCPTKILCHG